MLHSQSASISHGPGGSEVPLSLLDTAQSAVANSHSPAPSPLPPPKEVEDSALASVVDEQRVLELWSELANASDEQRRAVAQHWQLQRHSHEAAKHFAKLSELLASALAVVKRGDGLGPPHPGTVPSVSQLRQHANGDIVVNGLRWWLSCIFPPFSDKSVNHCRINGPLIYVQLVRRIGFHFAGALPCSWWAALWTWIGVFIALSCIGILHHYYAADSYDWPVLFASHGALATIIFVTPSNPVVQPYHMFVGTAVSTFLAVTIEQNMDTKQWLWLAVGLSAASSITLSQLLGCVHPPGGALSVLYIAVPTLHVLGYWYIIAAEVGVIVMFLTAIIINNLPAVANRQYPHSWFG